MSNNQDVAMGDDIDSDEDLQELSIADQQRAMAADAGENKNDTLDVSKLNYGFNLILNNSTNSTIKGQFIKPCNFFRQLDRHNTAHSFTVAQYRRAWRYAVDSKEEDFAVNQIVNANPGLDSDGINAIFTQQFRELRQAIDRLDVLTAEGRARRLHANVIAGIRQAHQDGLNGRHGRKMSQLKRIEKKWGFTSETLNLPQPRPKKKKKNKKARARGE